MAVPSLDEVRAFFRRAPFIADLGVDIETIGAGECTTSLAVAPRLLQHSGQVHAGVLTTLADHTAGAAAQTLAPEGSFVVTVELKISLLRPARGERLRCSARVLKPGKQVSFVEAEVYCAEGGGEQLAAKVSATMAMVSQKHLV
ncbi:MAG: PaaI family thioesterase [Burkholderiaceae bacterium]|nr:PaaI family thioesterase [Burkholderiaceae bacterium]